MRQYGRHSGAHRPLANDERPLAADQGNVAHAHAGHVSNSIERPCFHLANNNPQRARARALF